MTGIHLLMAAALLMGAAPANAACQQSAIAGFWAFSTLSQAPTGGIGWIACNIVVNVQGTIGPASSHCVSSGGLKSALTGRFSLVDNPTCLYRGSFDFVSTGARVSVPIVNLSLDRRTANGVGVGLPAGTSGGFSFNMVKTK